MTDWFSHMILVTGGSGQVATELARGPATAWCGSAVPSSTSTGRTRSRRSSTGVQPHLVVNAAAWTAVDAAETNEAAA